MTPVLLAIRDDDLRATLRGILGDDEGYEVLEAHNAITTLMSLLGSACPLTVLLDSHLGGREVVEGLLQLAVDGGPAGRHRYVLCTTSPLELLPLRLRERMKLVGASYLPMPFDLAELLHVIVAPGGTAPSGAQKRPGIAASDDA